MKTTILLFLVLSIVNTSFAQTSFLPYKDPKDWVGEKFIILPLSKSNISYGYKLKIGKDPFSGKNLSYKNGVMKTLTFVSKDDNAAHFIDSAGVQYTALMSRTVLDIAYLADWVEAKKLINKTFWLAVGFIPKLNEADVNITGLLYKPVTVVDAQLTDNSFMPIKLVLRTQDGQLGYVKTSLSGINANGGKAFYDYFLNDETVKAMQESIKADAVLAKTVEDNFKSDSLRIAQSGPGDPREWTKPDNNIGQSYKITPAGKSGYLYLKRKVDGKWAEIKTNVDGAMLTLVKVTKLGDDYDAYLKDAAGNEFKSKVDNGNIYGLIRVNEYEGTKKLLLNKPLWVKNPFKILNDKTNAVVELKRLDKVIVTDVQYGTSETEPVLVSYKTETGISTTEPINMGGPNALRFSNTNFDEKFHMENPKLKYKFTPLVWKQVINGDVVIGMPQDAVKLVLGTPKYINTTTSKGGTTFQYVYASGYYYFQNGKLIGTQL